VYNDQFTLDAYNDDTGELISSTVGGASGVHIPTAPQFTMGFGADYEVIKGLKFNANWNLYEKHYITDLDSFGLQSEDVGTLPSFFLVDAGLSYNFELGENDLIFTGNAYNILDRIALNGTDNFGFYNTNGLTWNASVKYKF